MDPGNLIIHLPLQARNLAVTLESDLSLSHPTSSPLPSSVESSPKYLLDATPPLHCHSLCPGSAPQPLSLLNHHQHFRTASPPAVCSTATGGMVLDHAAVGFPAYHDRSSWFESLSFERVISSPRQSLQDLALGCFSSSPFCRTGLSSLLLIYVFSHTLQCSLLLPPLWAWDSCLPILLTPPPRFSFAKNLL